MTKQEESSKELQRLDYDDSLLSFYSSCQQYGARQVLQDFHDQFPEMFREILAQINRIEPGKQVAALLR